MIEALINEIKSWWYVFVAVMLFFVTMVFGDILVSAMNKVKNILFGGDKGV